MSAVTASILVGTKHRVDLGIQPRWIVLLHEANGYAWHLLRLQLSSGDIVPPPKFGLLERSAPGTRAGLDAPPGILWRAAAGGDLVGELALLLHLHAARTPEVMAAVKHIAPLAKRRVDLAGLGGRQEGDLANALRIARETGGGLYLAVTIMAGSRLTEEDLLTLPEWEISLATTVLSRDWVRTDGGHLEVTDYRVPEEAEPDLEPVFGSVAFRGPDGALYAEYTYDAPDAPAREVAPYVVNLRDPRPEQTGATPAATPPRQAPAEVVPEEDEPAPPPALSGEDGERARRFGVRHGATRGRARVEHRDRERKARAEVLPDEDAGLDSAADARQGTWLDDFMRD
ncbi:MAG: hypothetical protein LCH98_17915 [Actinobacteria bacterium]|nr:hypothetical protein [Actinomycetota bacterium]